MAEIVKSKVFFPGAAEQRPAFGSDCRWCLLTLKWMMKEKIAKELY